MAVDHGSDNIRVNSIVVGIVWKEYVKEWSDSEVLEARRRAGVLPAEGAEWDVGHAALFLASDDARWITSESRRE